ncbi:MAG TPA: DNA repair exonuclease [Pirellulaceae bacterium]
MLKFVHAADIHLDSPLLRLGHYDDAPVELLRTATRRALVNLVQFTLEERADFVLIAGDLYDGDWDDVRTGLFLVKQLSRLGEAGIPVILIAGNHDAANRMTRHVRLPNHVRMLDHHQSETVILDRLGVAIHGQSFARQAVTENLARSYPDRVPGHFNIGLLHTALEGRDGHDRYAPCSLDDLRGRGYEYWALGHVHQREVLNESPHVAFCGNLQGRNIRETGPKGALLVTVEDERIVSEFQELDVVRWERLVLEARRVRSPDELLGHAEQQLTDLHLAAAGRPVAVRVEITGGCDYHTLLLGAIDHWEADLRAIAADVGCGELWIEKVTPHTRPLEDGVGSELDEGPLAEVESLVTEYLDEQADLKILAGTLEDLREKLPVELTQGPDALRLDDPNWLREILRGTAPFVRERLQRDGTSNVEDSA